MHVFTYGTLMIPEVMAAVTAGRFPSRPADLPGYVRYRVRDESYPGIVPAAGEIVSGVLYLDVTAAALARLDRFEGDLYERTAVTVRFENETGLPAATYIIHAAHRNRLTSEPWDLEAFRRDHLAGFLRNYQGFSVL